MSRCPILWAAADVGLGRSYGHTGDDTTDCVRFTAAILESAYPGAMWTEADRRDLLISHGDATRPWSPIDAAIRLRIGVEMPAHEMPPTGWSLCQGWRRLPGGTIPPADGRINGHGWLWYTDPQTSQGWVLQATNTSTDWLAPYSWREWSQRYTAGIRIAALRPPRRWR